MELLSSLSFLLLSFQYRIAKREGLMNAKLLEKFQELVKMLAEGKDEEVEIDYDDFPVSMHACLDLTHDSKVSSVR